MKEGCTALVCALLLAVSFPGRAADQTEQPGEEAAQERITVAALPAIVKTLADAGVDPMPRGVPLKLPSIASLNPGGDLTPAQAESILRRSRLRNIILQADRDFNAGRKNQAFATIEAERKRTSDKRTLIVLTTRLLTYAFRNDDYDTALTYAEELKALDPTGLSITLKTNLGGVLLSRGRHEEALELLESIDMEAVQAEALRWAIEFNLACAYSLAGDAGTAFSHLREAYIADPLSTQVSAGDPQLDFIRESPVFRDMIASLALPPLAREIRARPLEIDSYPYRPQQEEPKRPTPAYEGGSIKDVLP